MPIPFFKTEDNLLNIVILLPCHNEAIALPKVISSFKTVLPNAKIIVFDNASTDNTAAVAQQHNIPVIYVPQKGKGHVIRRMLADIDADIYVLVDADATYDAYSAPLMINTLIEKNLDMVIGKRTTISAQENSAYRRGHKFGNKLFNFLVKKIFGDVFDDIFSGYRVFTRRFAKSFPALTHGFDIETEISIHCLNLHIPTLEIETPYRDRPDGSFSKLNSYRDGFKILYRIVSMLKDYKPLAFFGSISAMLTGMAFVLGIPLIATFIKTGNVPRIPTAIIIGALLVVAFSSTICGVILNSVAKQRREAKLMAYLNHASIQTTILEKHRSLTATERSTQPA